MSVRCMTWVWDHSTVGGTERLVLLALADCANDEGRECWPSIATLARKCRVDERTVQRVIRRLAERGHLLILPSSGGRAANRYAVLMGGYPQPRQDATPGNPPPRQDATPAVAQVPGQGWHSSATQTSLNVLEPKPGPKTRSLRSHSPSSGAAPTLPGIAGHHCPRHPGQSLQFCGPCRSERLAGGVS